MAIEDTAITAAQAPPGSSLARPAVRRNRWHTSGLIQPNLEGTTLPWSGAGCAEVGEDGEDAAVGVVGFGQAEFE
jgi:hypothetical protein